VQRPSAGALGSIKIFKAALSIDVDDASRAELTAAL
jgi:hypothetical protein